MGEETKKKMLYCRKCNKRFYYSGNANHHTPCPKCGSCVTINPVYPKDWKKLPEVFGA